MGTLWWGLWEGMECEVGRGKSAELKGLLWVASSSLDR